VKPYVEKNKINYRIVIGTDGTAQLYGGVDSLPTTFLIDAQGKIASTHVGLVSKSSYENEIKQLIEDAKRAGVRVPAFAFASAAQLAE
jgi:cytochrome c biogenesis protein CcmG/thiol:disulfide interchange protein DsbE